MSAAAFCRVCVVAALLIGCAGRARTPAVTEFRGHYTHGFEISRFVPCHASRDDQPWWVILSPRALEQRDSVLATLPVAAGRQALFVHWLGTVGLRTSAGHLGQSTRYLQVTELLELRVAQGGDCARTG